MILGFDPGRDKCGVAVMTQTNEPERAPQITYAEVVPADEAIATVLSLMQRYPVSTIVMGDQTLSKSWKSRIENHLTSKQLKDPSPEQTPEPFTQIPIVMTDERYSSLEARERYWQLYPPQGLTKLIPQALRTIPRPIDDVVAIILIERYWHTLKATPDALLVSSVPERAPKITS